MSIVTFSVGNFLLLIAFPQLISLMKKHTKNGKLDYFVQIEREIERKTIFHQMKPPEQKSEFTI
jgi:hypothetical protein